MALNLSQHRQAAKDFAAQWKDKGYEKGESQTFWLSLLSKVLGVEEPDRLIRFEDQVMLDHTSFIDGFIPSTHVLIEQKSLGKNLRAPIKQSDGTQLTPFQQAKRYASELPYSDRPRWIVCCNFEEFLIYDMERPHGEPESILLKNLEQEWQRLRFLVNTGDEHIQRELKISRRAAELIGEIYDALLKEYKQPDSPETLRSLNILCVRLVFCMYAEDTDIFGERNKFCDYLRSFNKQNVRDAIIKLFRVLNQPTEQRDPYLDGIIATFPYVNGGLFAEDNVEIPRITPEIVDLIVDKACPFDWSEISPTIFGAMFESTLNPETRRSGGMHYTSTENIHKVIDPLFMDALCEAYHSAMAIPQEKPRFKALRELQAKMASLVFLDPACGSGNFLTETYISLRRLENDIIRELLKGQMVIGFDDETSPVKVSIDQFYGIEINDFAVTVARTAMWIAESQMLHETETIVSRSIDFLPLKNNPNIVEGDALLIDWNTVVPKERLSYIMGNPPFVGARLMNEAQKKALVSVFGKDWDNVGNLDFVTGWYKKASDNMVDTDIRTAFVSTNSVTQGEQVAALWKPLVENDGVHIDFAWRTFKWNSEASQMAAVHCVIVGFSWKQMYRSPILFDDGKSIECHTINSYLVDADNIFIMSRKTPLCNVPAIGMGNQPIDDGNYLFTKDEMEEFIQKEPKSEKYFHPFYGAHEFINRKPRFCLWLGECSPKELREMPRCMERIEAVRAFRLKSNRKSTVKSAETPTRFQTENMPDTNFLLVPKVSSEKRKYVPIGFMTPNNLVSDAAFIIPNATLYHFGVLTSNVHMAWMRTVCGRLKSDYRYSKDLVYNNFPWPTPTDAQREKIEQTAQAILDARAKFPDCSLADLYDEAVMPGDLRKAHQANDRAVMEAYGLPVKGTTESSCVAHLFRLYQELTNSTQE